MPCPMLASIHSRISAGDRDAGTFNMSPPRPQSEYSTRTQLAPDIARSRSNRAKPRSPLIFPIRPIKSPNLTIGMVLTIPVFAA